MLNDVRIMGHLGADPEARTTPAGATVANFRVACTETWKDQSGQKHESTEWVAVVAWRHLAETAQQYLRKGARVYVQGKLQTRTWEDKNGGGKRYATEVLADRLILVDRRDHQQEQPPGGVRSRSENQATRAPRGSYGNPSNASTGVDDDNLPF